MADDNCVGLISFGRVNEDVVIMGALASVFRYRLIIVVGAFV
jgi:hypothetical protein